MDEMTMAEASKYDCQFNPLPLADQVRRRVEFYKARKDLKGELAGFSLPAMDTDIVLGAIECLTMEYATNWVETGDDPLDLGSDIETAVAEGDLASPFPSRIQPFVPMSLLATGYYSLLAAGLTSASLEQIAEHIEILPDVVAISVLETGRFGFTHDGLKRLAAVAQERLPEIARELQDDEQQMAS